MYSASGLPAGASFDPETRQFSWTPDYTQAGEYTVTFTASDGTRSYSLSGTKTVTIMVRDVTVAEQLSGLKAAVAGLGVNGGVKNALTVKLDQAANLLNRGKTADAVSLLSADFIGQVNSLRSEGKLTQAEADALITAANETIQNITSQPTGSDLGVGRVAWIVAPCLVRQHRWTHGRRVRRLRVQESRGLAGRDPEVGQDLPRRRLVALLVDPLDQEVDRDLCDLVPTGIDARHRRDREARLVDVVESDHRHVVRDANSCLSQRAERS
jgi:PKD repeat protein